MILSGGNNIYGIPIGVLCLESYYTKVPGHIKNATTFDFPVTYKVVKGATPERVVNGADRRLLEPFIEAARELQEEGVKAITGSCGFLVIFQKELADSVEVPVFLSSLIQVPMVHRMLRSDQKVGLLVANKASLTQDHLKAVGADSTPVCVAGMDARREFCEVIIERRRKELDFTKLEGEVLAEVDTLVRENPDMGALVIECTDLPPFAHLIQQRFGIPVFDIITLTRMVYQAVAGKERGNPHP
ncbi:MAG: aspartate/glutamate racemase family protein [Syntrophobacteraceae bacterium]|nr:aspartate/glutamate racemase family protein [Desulfobacteraceae bacterium]